MTIDADPAGPTTVLVAGATGNVGGGIALALARKGVRTVLLGRSMDRLETRRQRLRSELPVPVGNASEARIETLLMDLSDMQSVRDGAREALRRFPRIDGLVLSSVVYLQNGPTILPNGHEAMFAANVLGPFHFTQLLVDRLSASFGVVLHVVAPFHGKIDWDDLESIRHHRTERAYNRSKTMGRMIAAELAHQHQGRIASLAFDPTFIIDRADPELQKRWPSGMVGLFWKAMTALAASPPTVAGEPAAQLLLSPVASRHAMNGALFRLGKRIPLDRAMRDQDARKRLWGTLSLITQ